MYRHRALAFVSFSFALASACGDDDPGTSQGQGGTANAGAAGDSSTAAGSGSGGASIGSSGAGGDSVGGASGMSGMAGNDSSSDNVTAEDVCERGCVKTESLNCPNDPADCEAACVAEYLDYPAACRGLVLAYGDCAADRPAGDFLCDEEGEAAPRDGICETESLAAAGCLLGAL
jgi:hypothetical protein